MRRALLFVNLKASQTEACVEEIAGHLAEGGLHVVRASAQSADDYATQLAAHKEDVDLVVAAGGDGTVRCAVEAILEVSEGRLSLGIIPLGTANNVARSLGLPLTVKEACQTIAAGHTVPMDVGRVNGRIFVSVVGIGLSTKVHEHVPAEQKKRWGPLAYAFQAVRLLIHRPPVFRAEIRTDGEKLKVRALQITVCNGKYYGAHLQIHPTASLCDGMLDLSIVEGKHHIRGLFKALLPLSTGHASPGLRLLTSRCFEISCRPAMKLDVEGSTDLRTPAQIEVLPAALRVFASAS